MKKIRVEKIFILWGVVINILMLFLIFKSPVYAVYDERFFYNNFLLLIEKGWSVDYILHMKNQAPGPLFEAFYYLLYKINIHVTVHVTRYCSLLFFNAGLFVIVKTFYKYSHTKFWLIYFALFSVPFIYPIIGLGLTEVISMFFLSLAVFYFKKFIGNRKLYLLLFFSVFYSIALIGRQNYLVTFPVFLFFLLIEKAAIASKLINLIFCFISILPLVYFISIWGGLVPPEQKGVSGSSLFDISINNGLLGVGYYGILFFIVNPGFFIDMFTKRILLITVIISLVLQMIARVQFLPFLSLFNKLSSIPGIVFYICPFFLITIGVYFSIVIGLFLKEDYMNISKILIVLLNFFMAFSSFKIVHLFSSRYVAQSGYLVTGFVDESQEIRFLRLKLFLLVIGSIAGLYSLHIYYNT